MSTFYRESGKYVPRELQHRFRKRIFTVLKIIVLVFFLHLFITSFFIQTYKIGTPSMANIFKPGELVLVTPFLYGPFVPFSEQRFFSVTNPKKNDLVVFIPEHAEDHGVMQKIGSQIVRFFTLNNIKSVSRETRNQKPQFLIRRIAGGPGDAVSTDGKNITVPEEHYFLIGTDGEGTFDSRQFGPVPFSQIKGKVILRYYPFRRLTPF